MQTQILYEDQDILVIRKPAGLAAQTARVDRPDVESELKNYLAPSASPFLVHRLDQPVEGLMAVGKNRKAAASLSAQLNRTDGKEKFVKRYYCVFYKNTSAQEGQLWDFLHREPGNRTAARDADAEGKDRAKAVSLSYRIVQETGVPLPADGAAIPGIISPVRLALAVVTTDTGRFHQIRAQMAHAGMPLLGDQKYGNDVSLRLSSALGIRNVALCAYSLEFAHPVSHKTLRFQITPQGKAFSYFSF